MYFGLVKIDRKQLFSVWKTPGKTQNAKISRVYDVVMNAYEIEADFSTDIASEVKAAVANTCNYFKKIWLKHHRSGNISMVLYASNGPKNSAAWPTNCGIFHGSDQRKLKSPGIRILSENHTRKISRKSTNQDLLNRFISVIGSTYQQHKWNTYEK